MGVNNKRTRSVISTVYAMFFAIYLAIGFQPADTTDYNITSTLQIPEIALASDVAELELEGRQLATPAKIVGSYSVKKNKTLLIGHSTTIFKNLHYLAGGDRIVYGGEIYKITDIKTVKKSAVNMAELLEASEQKTIVLMTCAGDKIGATDATHRLLITAEII